MTTRCKDALLLGIDGGGTKTDAVLCDGEGRVISRFVGGASGFTGIPREEAEAHLTETLDAVLQEAGGLSAPLQGVFAGIAGCGLAAIQERYQAFLERTLPGARRVRAGSDAINALSAGVGTGAGIIAIAGTGACIFCRENGRMARVSGWGYLLGDEGSGFDLGRRAITAALKALDGRGEETSLLALLEAHAGCPLSDWVPRIYAGDAKGMIAAAAPVLLQAAQAGDPVAQGELEAAAAGMARAIESAADQCAAPAVVLSGSVWKSSLYTQAVRAHVRPSLAFAYPDAPPVLGAVLEAAALAGIPAEEAFRGAARRGIVENVS